MLRAAEGATNTQIAAETRVSLPTVGLWRRNFCERRLDGSVATRHARVDRGEIDDDEVQRVLAKTLESAAGWQHALERAPAGRGDRDLADDGAPDLA